MSANNSAKLIGRLTRNPDTSCTKAGKMVTKFSIAVDRNYKNADGTKETDFFNVTVWERLAETCAKWLVKGGQVAVEGRIQNRKYVSRTGENRYTTEIIANDMYMLGGKKEPSSQGNGTMETPADTESLDNTEPDNVPEGYRLADGAEMDVPF